MTSPPETENGNRKSPPPFNVGLFFYPYNSIVFVAHAGKAFLKVVAQRLVNYYEVEGVLPEEQCGFRPERSTIDMMLIVRRLEELGREHGVPLYVCSK